MNVSSTANTLIHQVMANKRRPSNTQASPARVAPAINHHVGISTRAAGVSFLPLRSNIENSPPKARTIVRHRNAKAVSAEATIKATAGHMVQPPEMSRKPLPGRCGLFGWLQYGGKQAVKEDRSQ